MVGSDNTSRAQATKCAPKGQQLLAQGNALGAVPSEQFRPVRAKDLLLHAIQLVLLPLQGGRISLSSNPRALPRAGSFCPFRANFPRTYHLPHIYNRPHHIYNRPHHIYSRPPHIYIGALIALLFSLSLTLAAQTDRGANFPSALHLAQKGNAEGRKKLTASLDSLHRYGIRALRLTVPLAAPEANDNPAAPPSKAATRFSKMSEVGFIIRV